MQCFCGKCVMYVCRGVCVVEPCGVCGVGLCGVCWGVYSGVVCCVCHGV